MAGTGRIADLVARLERLSADDFREGIAKSMAETARKLIDRGFATASSPYDRWRPRLHRYPWPIMQKSGTARRDWSTETGPGGFVVRNDNAPYLFFQQFGTRTGITPREIVPSEAFGLGSWRDPLDRACVGYFRQAMRD